MCLAEVVNCILVLNRSPGKNHLASHGRERWIRALEPARLRCVEVARLPNLHPKHSWNTKKIFDTMWSKEDSLSIHFPFWPFSLFSQMPWSRRRENYMLSGDDFSDQELLKCNKWRLQHSRVVSPNTIMLWKTVHLTTTLNITVIHLEKTKQRSGRAAKKLSREEYEDGNRTRKPYPKIPSAFPVDPCFSCRIFKMQLPKKINLLIDILIDVVLKGEIKP